jgi:hypothetical protein
LILSLSFSSCLLDIVDNMKSHSLDFSQKEGLSYIHQ